VVYSKTVETPVYSKGRDAQTSIRRSMATDSLTFLCNSVKKNLMKLQLTWGLYLNLIRAESWVRVGMSTWKIIYPGHRAPILWIYPALAAGMAVHTILAVISLGFRLWGLSFKYSSITARQSREKSVYGAIWCPEVCEGLVRVTV